VDGSATSVSQPDTSQDYPYASRQTNRDDSRLPTQYDDRVPYSNLGGWIDDQAHGRLPEPTYGYNGHRPTNYLPTLSDTDILQSIHETHWPGQQYIQPTSRVNGGGGSSRRDDRLPRSRSRERHADDRHERHNSRERHERRERRERREYHEAHAYSEHRDRDQRRFVSPEPMYRESNGRRRHRSRSREPRYR
jgi:hypothetical protein